MDKGVSELGEPLLSASLPRVISRAQGLKLVVETLMSSLKPIGNIVVICCAFFIIFGILGVQVCEGLGAAVGGSLRSGLRLGHLMLRPKLPPPLFQKNKQGHFPRDLMPQAPLPPGHFAKNWEPGTGPLRAQAPRRGF